MSSIVKVDTIQENTSANGITVDGLNIKDSKLVTANSVVAANITADAIDATKIADNAISEEHLDVTSITGHTAETSIADGDTILIHDASASALRKMTKANFVSGIGGANTPAFSATINSQTLSANTATLIQFDTMLLTEPSSTYNTSTYKFTPGVAGTYQVSATIAGTAGSSHAFAVYIKKNGSTNYYMWEPTTFAGYSQSGSRTITLDADDYIQLYANVGMSNKNIGSINTQWSAFRIIE